MTTIDVNTDGGRFIGAFRQVLGRTYGCNRRRPKEIARHACAISAERHTIIDYGYGHARQPRPRCAGRKNAWHANIALGSYRVAEEPVEHHLVQMTHIGRFAFVRQRLRGMPTAIVPISCMTK